MAFWEIASLVPGLAGGVIGHFANRSAKKRLKKYNKAQLQATLNAIDRAEQQHGEDTELGRQKLSQSMASRGLWDSTIKTQAMDRFARARARAAANLADKRDLARQAYRAFRKKGRLDNMMDMIGMGQYAASAGIAAGSMWPKSGYGGDAGAAAGAGLAWGNANPFGY